MGEMTAKEARGICHAFANKLGVEFHARGEVGFGRPCVGFQHGGSYLDYNPYDFRSGEFVFEDCRGLNPPHGVNFYHKHDCMAVLAEDEDDASYDEAIVGLALWVQSIEAHGEPYLSVYRPKHMTAMAMMGKPDVTAIRLR